MAKKLGPPIFLGVFTVLAIIFLTGGASDDKDALRQTFHVEAIYYDAGFVEVSYLDNSDKTIAVTMEVLGMDETFHKTFSDSEFIEIIPFSNEPKYGWSIHPIVLEIDHEEFGHIQLKTEIHPVGGTIPPVIYSAP
ncbi:hypothetical protein [Candidatus Nitrosopumilus sediminis]|uniref:Uncharacterized protein n=1 Tax=Candidatus Nitrosopumilus sediminis TaxID=1229909 RepID=K0BBT5_9ARCH|nr:hypothetical protein [Candidatus Nitrosopumilus sediminis]AFS82899.1 hypothetical protein NSED_05485 [Candidatus Nitrosopumilus sediminis]